MNLNTHNHSEALKTCQAIFDRPPYNLMGDGLPHVAGQVETGDCATYRLLMPSALIKGQDTLLGLIEVFSAPQCPGAVWEGLGDSLKAKIAARRNIDYYRLNFQERIRFIDADHLIGDEDGAEIEAEIQALFPELSFAQVQDGIQVTFRLPNRY